MRGEIFKESDRYFVQVQQLFIIQKHCHWDKNNLILCYITPKLYIQTICETELPAQEYWVDIRYSIIKGIIKHSKDIISYTWIWNWLRVKCKIIVMLLKKTLPLVALIGDHGICWAGLESYVQRRSLNRSYISLASPLIHLHRLVLKKLILCKFCLKF